MKKFLSFLLNPKLLLCLGIAWFITNGWSYAMFGLGTFFGIKWMIAVGGAYMAFLWFPFTPEKIVTVFIAIWLLRLIFPNDEKTLAVLYEMRDRIKEKMRARKEARKSRKNKQ